MAHVCSFDTHGHSEYLTVEEALKRLYPNAKQFILWNHDYVCCTCYLLQEAKAIVSDVYPDSIPKMKRTCLKPYCLGDNKAKVWIAECTCGNIYYNTEEGTKVIVRILGRR